MVVDRACGGVQTCSLKLDELQVDGTLLVTPRVFV